MNSWAYEFKVSIHLGFLDISIVEEHFNRLSCEIDLDIKFIFSLTPNSGTGINTSSSNDLSMSPDKTSSISNSAPSQGSTTAIVPIRYFLLNFHLGV